MPAADAPIHTNLLPRIVPFAGLRVREDSAYTNASGIEKSRIRKRAEGDLRKAGAVLKNLLQPNEVVLRISRGAFMPGNFEQIVSVVVHVGYLLPSMSFFDAVLVFTDSRLIALRATRKFLGGWTWDQGIFTVDWADLTRATTRGWLLPYVELVDQRGDKERFWQLGLLDAASIKLLLDAFGPTSLLAAARASDAFRSFCPKCFAALVPRVYTCRRCGAIFKNEKQLLIRALLIPGGAYFYSGRKFLGAFSALIETAFLYLAVAALLTGANVPLGWFGFGSGAVPRDYLIYGLELVPIVVLLKAVGIYCARRLLRKFILA